MTVHTPARIRLPDYALGYETLDGEITLESVPVEGRIPDWIHGSLVRLGPGKFDVGGQKLGHHFCGFGMLHRFGFENGRVSYRNRYIDSRGYRIARDRKTLGYNSYANRVSPERFQEILAERAAGMEPNINANVSITKIDGEYVALTDGSTLPVRYDQQTLETLGIMRFDDPLASTNCLGEPGVETRRVTTAHYQRCIETGDLINYFAEVGGRPGYNVFRIPAGSRKREPIAFVPTDSPSYMHAFHITPRYIVLPESPCRFSVADLAKGVPFGRSLSWRKDVGLRLHVIDRHEKRLLFSVELEPGFVEHTINAFERPDGELVVDGARYDDASHLDDLFLDPTARPAGGMYDGLEVSELISHAVATRFRIDVNRRTVVQENPSDVAIELPTIDYMARNGRPYRVFYAASISDERERSFYNQLARVDLDTGATTIWNRPGMYPGEAVFIKDPASPDPDSGVVLSVVLDTKAGKSFLAILDAQTFDERAIVRLPHHIPFHFHGQFHPGRP